jgi:hypothetical protein
MNGKYKRVRPERSYIDTFGPMPSMRRQVFTIALAGAAMVFVSVAMVQFGLM